jgi:DNA replication protein DnaD
MEGWIKIYRKIMENPMYFSEPFTRMQAWLDLLLLANIKDAYYYVRGNKVVVHRGQVGLSEVALAKRWKWSRSKVSRFLKYLENEQQIEQQKNSVTTLISIINYNEYQKNEQQIEQQTSSRKAAEKPHKEEEILPLELFKEEDMKKKENKESTNVQKKVSQLSLEERKRNFYDCVLSYSKQYDKEMLQAFYDWWSEPDWSNKKMNFELQKTWSLAGRLRTWYRRSINGKR